MAAPETNKTLPADPRSASPQEAAPTPGDQRGRSRRASEHQEDAGESLRRPGRQLRQDANALLQDARDVAEAIEGYLGNQLRERPYTTLAIASGAGYLIGGGLATRFNRMALALAGRVFIGMMARELGSRLDPLVSGDLPHGNSIQ